MNILINKLDVIGSDYNKFYTNVELIYVRGEILNRLKEEYKKFFIEECIEDSIEQNIVEDCILKQLNSINDSCWNIKGKVIFTNIGILKSEKNKNHLKYNEMIIIDVLIDLNITKEENFIDLLNKVY